MPILFGAGVSHSPLMYRPREQWGDVSRVLTGNVVQPASREMEDAALLEDYERRIEASLEVIADAIAAARLDVLIVLYADRGGMFDISNLPQLHVQVGGDVWGDSSLGGLDEAPRRASFACREDIAELLIEELVSSGFDVSEARNAFKPIGPKGFGIGPAVVDSLGRLAQGLPIIPIHVNCHTAPTLPGRRLIHLGEILTQAAALSDQRIGILVSGGLSGDPGGPMGGWIDNVLDEWVLSRLERAQSAALATVWGARSRTLEGNSAEIRLWAVAGAALERAQCRARIIDYLPVHHGATGIAFVTWGDPACR